MHIIRKKTNSDSRYVMLQAETERRMLEYARCPLGSGQPSWLKSYFTLRKHGT